MLGARFGAWGTIFLLFTLCLQSAGCKFFGKQDEVVETTAPGVLEDGASIVGTWSQSYSSIARDGNPDTVVTTTFSFDPTGVSRIELRDGKQSGGVCTGYGQYRILGGQTVVVYLQAVTPNNCALPAVLELPRISVSAGVLSYTETTGGNRVYLFAERAQRLAPVGVWNFEGAGGIDYVYFDHLGYFLLQTTVDDEHYLLQGYYEVSAGGGLKLTYFMNGNPADELGTSSFDQFLTNGQELRLIQTTSQGEIALDGVRL